MATRCGFSSNRSHLDKPVRRRAIPRAPHDTEIASRRRRILLTLALGILAACSPRYRKASSPSPDAALTSELPQRVALDQAVRERFTVYLGRSRP